MPDLRISENINKSARPVITRFLLQKNNLHRTNMERTVFHSKWHTFRLGWSHFGMKISILYIFFNHIQLIRIWHYRKIWKKKFFLQYDPFLYIINPFSSKNPTIRCAPLKISGWEFFWDEFKISCWTNKCVAAAKLKTRCSCSPFYVRFSISPAYFEFQMSRPAP